MEITKLCAFLHLDVSIKFSLCEVRTQIQYETGNSTPCGIPEHPISSLTRWHALLDIFLLNTELSCREWG